MRDIDDLPRRVPEHLGFAHDVWPCVHDWKPSESTARDACLDDIVKASALSSALVDSYRVAYRRWAGSVTGDGHRSFVARATGRLLVGSGNPSPTEVGLALHHTWGVPYIPGSALEGLLGHYVHTCYGPAGTDDGDRADDRARAPFAGPRHSSTGRAIRRPGRFYTRMFGSPPVIDNAGVSHPARRGSLIVHDALWVPPATGRAESLLSRDVLTPHHTDYYNVAGSARALPADYDDPVPVSFLTVRPGTRFLVALSSSDRVVLARAIRYLGDALATWGVGAKTTAGYGRLRRQSEA